MFLSYLSCLFAEEFPYEVGPSYLPEVFLDLGSLLWLVPEEEHSLPPLFFVALCREDPFHRVWVVAGCPARSGYGERRGREVLYLFEPEVHLPCLYGEIGHVFGRATRMAAYEVGYYLLPEPLAQADVVKRLPELPEEVEGWLAHQAEDLVGRVLGGNLEPSADMLRNELMGVLPGCFIEVAILPVVEE